MKEAMVGVSQLRTMNAASLAALDGVVLILGRKVEGPIAALVPYETYLLWQKVLESAPLTR